MAAIILEGARPAGAPFTACHPRSVSLANRSAYNQQVAGEGQAGLPNGREEGEEKVFIARKGAWPPGESRREMGGGRRRGLRSARGKERREGEKGFYGGGAELDAYVSRGIMACPDVGDGEVLDSSRHRMTAVFGSEGHRQRGILPQAGRGPGWAWGVWACAPAVVRVGRGERAASDRGLCLPAGQILRTPQASCFLGPGKPGVPSFQSGLVCNA